MIRSADDSDEARLTAFAQEAASLDAVRGDPTRIRGRGRRGGGR